VRFQTKISFYKNSQSRVALFFITYWKESKIILFLNKISLKRAHILFKGNLLVPQTLKKLKTPHEKSGTVQGCNTYALHAPYITKGCERKVTLVHGSMERVRR